MGFAQRGCCKLDACWLIVIVRPCCYVGSSLNFLILEC